MITSETNDTRRKSYFSLLKKSDIFNNLAAPIVLKIT